MAKILLAMLLLVAAPGAMAAPKGWENVKTVPTESRSVAKEGDLEVKMAKGAIIITTTQQVQVKVFSILGQLVSSETLQPGTSQLQLSGHGVYIVKIGELTCKVAL